MRNKHSATAVTLNLEIGEYISCVFTCFYALHITVPKVTYDLTTTKTSNWNEHLESPVGLLLLLTSAAAHLMLGFLATGVVYE